ncbi:MAG: polysaccharide biosynthesis tyrosine autokinase [Planctomycetes bacterium]|nr:polysaccharide biosynthesis tyrosine autokinase [Planctomycetota bacterium]
MRSRKHVVILALLVSSVLAGLYLITATPIYESKASLLVLQTGADRWSTTMSREASSKDLIATYRRILDSEVVLEEAIALLRKESRGDFKDGEPSELVASVKRNLAVASIRGTSILEVKYSSENPQKAAAVVDSILRAYLAFMDKLHKGAAQELLDILTKEKASLEKQLLAKESEFLAARSRAGDLVIRDENKGLNVVVARVMRLNDSLIAAQTKRLEAQSQATTIEVAIRNNENLQSYASAMMNSVGQEIFLKQVGFSTSDAATISRTNQQLLENRAKLQSELQYYGPAHRRVRLLQDQIRVAEQYLQQNRNLTADTRTVDDPTLKPLLTEMAHQQLQQAIDHENVIRASYEEEKEQAVALDHSTAQLDMLQLDVQRLRGFYDLVLERIKNIDLGRENSVLKTSVLSRPEVPSRPIQPRLSLVALLAVAIGLGGGLAIVYVQDLLDDRFRSLEELRTQLGVPVLTTVGNVETAAKTGIDAVHTHIEPTTVESESFRTLRTALTFCHKGIHRLVVSSSEPGDGKTTVSANLANVYAQADKRTLLIDADMRRPGLTALLGLREAAGLSTCLLDDGPIAKITEASLQPSIAEHLDVLPSGPRLANASELLASDRFAELLSWAEVHYDQIVIDSSPMLVSDTAVIGQLVDGVVLVVQPAKNHRRIVLRTADRFALLGVKLLGVVVNRAMEEDSEDYGYGYKYGYGYGHDNEESPENAGDTPHLVRPIRRSPRRVA